MNIIKKLLLLLIIGGATSCGSTFDVTASSTYTTGTCSTATYQWGVYGWGFYDCYGQPVGAGIYSYQRFNYGPRIIFTQRPRKSNTVRSSTRRGSRVSNTPHNVVRSVQPRTGGSGAIGNNTGQRGRRGNKNKY